MRLIFSTFSLFFLLSSKLENKIHRKVNEEFLLGKNAPLPIKP